MVSPVHIYIKYSRCALFYAQFFPRLPARGLSGKGRRTGPYPVGEGPEFSAPHPPAGLMSERKQNMTKLKVINEPIQQYVAGRVRKLVMEMLEPLDLDDEIIRHVALEISDGAFSVLSPWTVPQHEYDEALKEWYTKH